MKLRSEATPRHNSNKLGYAKWDESFEIHTLIVYSL